MLNELVIVEQGLPQELVASAMRNADIHSARQRAATLRVNLNESGRVESVSPIPDGVRLWTLRTHNDNSFPFIQVKTPVSSDSSVETWRAWKRSNPRPKPGELRERLLEVASGADVRGEGLGKWSTATVMSALRRRLGQVASLRKTPAGALPAALERFLRACDPEVGGSVARFVTEIRDRAVDALKTSSDEAWIRCAVALLLEGDGSIFLGAGGNWGLSLTDHAILGWISTALDESDQPACGTAGLCSLTGRTENLVGETFPQVDFPTIGPTIIFARYKGRFANDRYSKSGAGSMPVGELTARRLAAAARVLTAPERKGVTWRPIPGERPKQVDLLLAFVESANEEPIASVFAEDDMSQEAPAAEDGEASSIAAFEKRTERLVDALQAKLGDDFRQTPVQLAILRKVDRANRKVVYVDTPTVGSVYDAVQSWAAGERNVPPWLTLPVFYKGEAGPRRGSPPHVAPLGVIGFSRTAFVRGGSDRQDVVGLPASDCLEIFLSQDLLRALPVLNRVLRSVLTTRTSLVGAAAHVQHTPGSWDRRNEATKRVDPLEALRTVSVMGILLYKLLRPKEEYMNDAAFRLGQLLAAVDIVHAGYCADIRDGGVPPSLLGNQVFAAAQSSPEKSLAMLCRRWKPYAGWAAKAARNLARADALVSSKKREDQQRGWDIRKAVRHAREVSPLASELVAALANCKVDDKFRAELLLGYLAGLPKAQIDDDRKNSEESNISVGKEENHE